jgi:DNA-binding LacI/PurR family transcriptional regulator
MPSIQDVAKRARVSTATVSHVINQNYPVSAQRRERVLKAIRELEYHPNAMARGLRTSKSKTVGMIIPDITNPFFPAVVRAAEDVLNHAGYALLVGNSDNAPRKEEAYYRAFREKRVDGLLLIAAGGPLPPEYLRNHHSEDVPVVFIDRYYRGIPADSIQVDNVSGSYQAVIHLIETGHHRVGMITGPLSLGNAKLRLEGYLHALEEHKIAEDPTLIFEGKFDFRSGYERAKCLLDQNPRPTAIFASNGEMMKGCLQALGESAVRVPDEIALVSFDDFDWFALGHPTITAVAQPMYDLGALGAEILLKRIMNKLQGRPRKKVLPAKLIVRESSKAR